MKKIIILLLIVLACTLPPTADATNYFGCASANVNADNTFCATPSGSCAGSSAVSAATALQAGNTLYANGCTVAIPTSGANISFTVDKISNKDGDAGGAAVEGGQFQVATNASYTATINANIETGGTTGACLAITGTAAGAARVTINATTIDGGTGTNMFGVSDTHTVGTVVVNATTTTGGSGNGAHGYYYNGATGTLTWTGDGVGTSGTASTYGIAANGAGSTTTISGNCTAGAGSGNATGCNNSGAGTFTITGNIINSARSHGAGGAYTWTPGASNYMKILTGAGPTYLYVGLPPAGDKVLTTGNYIKSDDGVLTAGSATSGGASGAWSF